MKKKYDDYVRFVKRFYELGANSFLTKDPSNVGDDESFYMHVVRFYFPQIMKKLYKEFGVGIGVCTMQGFERRNKESKNTMKRFYNGKGNIIMTNLKRLWLEFYYGTNNM